MPETIRSLARGLEVLRHLERHWEGQTLRQLKGALEIPKPSLLRVLETLREQGFVHHETPGGLWHCSVQRRAAPTALSPWIAEVREAAARILPDLCREISWPSDVSLYQSGMMEIVATSRHLTPIHAFYIQPGFRVNVLPTAMGRTWLAFCSDQERAAILADLRHSRDANDAVPRRDELDTLLKRVRTLGYGDRASHLAIPAGSYSRLDKACALPVMTPSGIVACVSVTFSSEAVSQTTFETELRPILTRHIRTMERRLNSERASA